MTTEHIYRVINNRKQRVINSDFLFSRTCIMLHIIVTVCPRFVLYCSTFRYNFLILINLYLYK